MLRNKKVACLVFLSALFMGGGGLLVGNTYADESVIAPEGWDVKFFECVNEQIHFPSLEEEVIEYYLGTFQFLECPDMGIEDVSQLKKMPNLEYLDLTKNQITEIDLSENMNLYYLGLSENKLSSIDLSKNTALKDLYLADNELTFVDISKNTALKNLYLADNELTFVDISKNTSLERFDVDDIYVKAAISHEEVDNKVIFHFSGLLFLNYYVYPKSVDNVMQYSVSDGNLVVSELGQTNGYVQIVKVASMDPTTGAIEENYFKVLLLARVLFLDLNDGSGETEILVCGLDAVDDGSCLVTLPEGPSREGYVFKGWAVGSEEDDLVHPGEKIKLEDEETKITAVWGEESEENEEKNEDKDEDEIGVPDTGYNTNSDNNNTAFVVLALPIMILIVGIVAYIRDLKKSHVKFD